jgi:hypothetical protein
MADYPPPDKSRELQKVIAGILADPRRQENIRRVEALLLLPTGGPRESEVRQNG